MKIKGEGKRSKQSKTSPKRWQGKTRQHRVQNFAVNRKTASSIVGFLNTAAGRSCGDCPSLSEFTEQLLRAGMSAICCQLHSTLTPRGCHEVGGEEHPTPHQPGRAARNASGVCQQAQSGPWGRATRLTATCHTQGCTTKRSCPTATLIQSAGSAREGQDPPMPPFTEKSLGQPRCSG